MEVQVFRNWAKQFSEYELTVPRSGKGFPVKINNLTFSFAQDGQSVVSNGRLWDFVTTIETPLGCINVCTYTHPLFADFVITETFRPDAISEETVEEIIRCLSRCINLQVAIKTGEFEKV